MKTKIEVKGEIESREDLEKWMGEYARAELALRDAKLERDRAVTAAREAFEAREPVLKTALEAAFKQLELWARSNPEAFKGAKTLELVQGRIGYRTGMPRVSLPRGTDEEELCGRMECTEAGEFVRRVPMLDKQKVIRTASSEEPAEKAKAAFLAKQYGVLVRQTERFFAESRQEKPAE